MFPDTTAFEGNVPKTRTVCFVQDVKQRSTRIKEMVYSIIIIEWRAATQSLFDNTVMKYITSPLLRSSFLILSPFARLQSRLPSSSVKVSTLPTSVSSQLSFVRLDVSNCALVVFA